MIYRDNKALKGICMTMPEDNRPTDMLEVYRICGPYNLYNVFQRTTPDLRTMAIDLWHRNHALPSGVEPQHRAHQVAIMAVNNEGETIGVTTVYKGELNLPKKDKEDVYFLRIFIQSQDRIPEMMSIMTDETCNILDNMEITEKPMSVVSICENHKLMKPGLKRKLARIGFHTVGQDNLGQDIIQRNF